MSKTEIQMVTSDVSGLKENMWKLSSRVLLMEKFIQKQFGDVFWEFCQDHVDSADDADLPGSPTPPSVPPAVTVTLIHSSAASSSIPSSNSESSSNNASPVAAPPPPPPLIPASSLAMLTGGGSNSVLSGGRTGPRNFLPKSLASVATVNNKPKPVLRTATLSSTDSHQGAQRIVPSQINSSISDERTPIIKQVGRMDSVLKSALRASPVATTSNRVRPAPPLRAGNTPPTKPMSLKRVMPIKYEKVDEDEDEPDEKRMMSTIENLIGYNTPGGRSVNIIRSMQGIKAETDGYSAAHNGFLREMRPNPCHTRCQNRCHDIWTESDRMDVFQMYWSIPTEEERRQWVAERIERVDMATKKTEYSNFRTCTFKYYFPHPENSRVQVCKNFFLATIDEKRSYVEKIAQEVKGISEHYSIQDIPFRRKNQMKNCNGSISVYNLNSYDTVGWMTGVDDNEDGDGQEQDEEYEGDDGDVDGMEMEEIVP